MRSVDYGAWPSPLSPDVASTARISVGNLVVGRDGSWWWSESRPQEGGRQVVVRRRPGSDPEVVSPDGVSVRTRVHEYGGAAYTVAGDELVFVSLEDEGLWACVPGGPDSAPTGVRMTPPPPARERHRYGDPQALGGSGWVVAIRERHHDGGVDDEVVAVPRPGHGSSVVVLVSGRDFYGAVRPDPRGGALAWTCWDHPNMPWDASELWVAPVVFDSGDGGDTGAVPAAVRRPTLGQPRLVSGGADESVGQPTWGVDGRLFFVSDRAGWWQPYAWTPGTAGAATHTGGARRLCAEEAEFHAPDWALGQSTLAPLEDGRLACRFRRRGRDHVGIVDAVEGMLTEVAQPCVSISALRTAGPRALAVVGATADEPVAVHEVVLAPAPSDKTVHRPRANPLPAGWTAAAEAFDYPTGNGASAHLQLFLPRAAGISGPDEARPPLVVYCHGGPTGAAETGFDLGVQLWTTRGFAVALVDYRGSSGYGRAYREMLRLAWGEADAEDAMAAATFLAARGTVDGGRMVVRGGSAGGYTALRALRRGGPFAAALVSYGVTDLAALARDTHKFESRYLDGLVGPWPEAAERYAALSPAVHPEELEGAVLLLQGDEDPVVPPDQARRMADALRGRGLRCELEFFAGEGHGFRRAETLARAAELELSFAASVLGLPGAR